MRLILQDGFWIVHITLVRMVKFKFLAQFPVDRLPHPVVLYFFVIICYMWLFVSSLSPHNLHSLLCCVVSIFALTELILYYYYYYYYFTASEFFKSALAIGHLLESEWRQVSWALFWTDINNAVVWRVSILPVNSDSSNLFSKTLRTIPRAPTTISINSREFYASHSLRPILVSTCCI